MPHCCLLAVLLVLSDSVRVKYHLSSTAPESGSTSEGGVAASTADSIKLASGSTMTLSVTKSSAKIDLTADAATSTDSKSCWKFKASAASTSDVVLCIDLKAAQPVVIIQNLPDGASVKGHDAESDPTCGASCELSIGSDSFAVKLSNNSVNYLALILGVGGLIGIGAAAYFSIGTESNPTGALVGGGLGVALLIAGALAWYKDYRLGAGSSSSEATATKPAGKAD